MAVACLNAAFSCYRPISTEMRLTTAQQQAIVQIFLEVFGHGEIRLFGSRADDSQRGGDIDLYVTTDNQEKIAEKRITFLARLKRKIGDQKIDLVMSPPSPERAIDIQALTNGVVLCRKH
jgi:uncharacterized protein